MNKRNMWIFLDNDIIHFLLGVRYTRCISTSRYVVCYQAREMTQHTDTSAHRAVFIGRQQKSMWVLTSKTNLHPEFLAALMRRISELSQVCVYEGVMTEGLWSIWYDRASKTISWLKEIFSSMQRLGWLVTMESEAGSSQAIASLVNYSVPLEWLVENVSLPGTPCTVWSKSLSLLVLVFLSIAGQKSLIHDRSNYSNWVNESVQ